MHKACDIFLFEFYVCVEESFITFASSPKNVTFSAEFNREVERFLHLSRRKAKNVRAVGASRTVHKAGIAEHIRRSPKAFDTSNIHLLKDIIGDFV